MKTILLLLLSVPFFGQSLTPIQFRALAQSCVPEADATDLTMIVKTESSFRPYALSVNRPEAVSRQMGYSSGRIDLRKQPRTAEEAVRWARELAVQGITVSLGLMQLNAESGQYSFEELIDPCLNIKIGWRLFIEKYNRAAAKVGPGQKALRIALSLYNSGSFRDGFTNGYVWANVRNAQP